MIPVQGFRLEVRVALHAAGLSFPDKLIKK